MDQKSSNALAEESRGRPAGRANGNDGCRATQGCPVKIFRRHSRWQSPLWTCIFLVVSATNALGAPLVSPSEAVLRRFDRLANISVAYSEAISDTPDVEYARKLLSEEDFKLIVSGDSNRSGVYQSSFGRKHLVLESVNPSGQYGVAMTNGLQRYETVYTPQRVETLSLRTSGATGLIVDQQDAPLESLYDVVLGLRCNEEGHWLDRKDFQLAEIEKTTDHHVLLRIPSRGSKYIWTFDNDTFERIIGYTRLGEHDAPLEEMSYSDFVNVNGLSLPKTVVFQEVGYFGGKRHIVRTTKLVVTKIEGDEATVPSDAYQLMWPLGTTVLDKRIGQVFKVASKSRTLSDEDIYRSLRSGATTQGGKTVGYSK